MRFRIIYFLAVSSYILSSPRQPKYISKMVYFRKNTSFTIKTIKTCMAKFQKFCRSPTNLNTFLQDVSKGRWQFQLPHTLTLNPNFNVKPKSGYHHHHHNQHPPHNGQPRPSPPPWKLRGVR